VEHAQRREQADRAPPHGSTVVGTKIYAIGGQTGHDGGLTTRADVQVFDTAAPAGGWQTLAPLPTARGHISSSTFTYGGRIFVMGGETAHGTPIGTVSVFDPAAGATGTWTNSTSLPAPRVSGVAGAIGGRFVFTTGGGSAATYIGAPASVPGGCLTVSELPCSQVKAGLPARIDFTGTEGGLYDAQGQDLGFTMVHPANGSGGYRPERLDVTGGTLKVRTTAGINYKSATTGGTGAFNELANGVGVGVDATKPLRIETTVVKPALGSGAAEQAAVWFGPDQDNYVKVDLASSGASAPYHRPQLVWEVGGNATNTTEISLDNDLSRNYANANVKLVLELDPVSRTATGAFEVDGGGRQLIGTTGPLPAVWFAGSTAEQGSGYAGIFATHRNRAATLGALTYTFGDFAVTDTTPDNDAPNMVVDASRVVLNDATATGTGTTTKAITVRNTGGSALTLSAPTVADDPGEADDDASQWTLSNGTTTIPAGGQGTVTATFAATSTGVKAAVGTIRSNDPDGPTAEVRLRGLGMPTYNGGGDEPSLQRVMDAYEIPVDIGDVNPATSSIDSNNTVLGEEITVQRFEKAGAGAVSIEPLGQFSPSANPQNEFGHHTPGDRTDAARTSVFVNQDDTTRPDHQTLEVGGGLRTFDPGTGAFATFTRWQQFLDGGARRVVSQEDALNTWETTAALRHKVRVYPMKAPGGAVIQNAYVLGIEEVPGQGDFQDFVAVIRNVKPVARQMRGEVDTENLDKVPFKDRLVMNRIQTPDATTPNVVHDQSTVRIRNTHATETLSVTGLALGGTSPAAFQLVNPPAFPRDVPPGGSVDVTVKFVATTPTGNPINRQFDATLNVLTSDADEATYPVELSGMWQRQSEGGTEPDVAQIVRSYGYGTSIVKAGQNINNEGRLEKIGDEVHSKYWKRASTSAPVVVRQLAAFHTQGNVAAFKITRKGSTTAEFTKLVHAGEDGQSYLPRKNDTARTIGEASFTPTAAETGTTSGTDASDGTFGLKIDPEHSDWTLNNQTPDACRATPDVCGLHLRTWPAKDKLGRLIPNLWIVVMDYAGINYDFNDNVYLVENIRPELDADDPSTLKPCTPVACEQIGVSLPFDTTFSAVRTPGYTDKDDQATGLTYLLPTTNGTGYVKPNIDLDTTAGQLRLTTTAGITVNSAGANGPGNSQDNTLGIGLRWPATGAKRQMITTRVADVPANPTGGNEQGGLWFGNSEDDLVKLHVRSATAGQWLVETNLEQGGVFQAPAGSATAGGVLSPVLPLAGRSVDLKLTADPATRRVSAHYQVEGGAETLLATWLVPASFFSQGPGAITDERVGTSSFAGLFGSHRSATGNTPLTFAFDRFGVADDATQQKPRVTAVRPADGATGVPLTDSISTDLDLPNGGIDADSIKPEVGSVRLVRVADGTLVPGGPGTSGGFDTISFAPAAPLAPNTQYRFEITSAAKDQSGVNFEPFSSTFTTGTTSSTPTQAEFTKLAQATATAPKYSGFTTIEIGPDRKLYGLRNDGLIKRWPIGADGALGQAEEFTTLQSDGPRLGVGLVFDPASTATNPIVWVSHSTLGFDNMPDWGGAITRLSGANLGSRQDVVTNLPRSAKDHVTNSLEFGPDGNLYFPQGSNSAMGRRDGNWRDRDERLLTAAILKLDPRKLPPASSLPIDAKTEELPAGQSPYDPFAAGAPLTIHATGLRNAYDLVWHSNGSLYVPTNGSAAGGNTPVAPSPRPASCARRIDGSPYPATAPSGQALTNVQQTMPEFIFRVNQGGYYGHPNPTRCEWS
jgi:hypothetical protein